MHFKTCNFPANATQEDVADAYFLGWEQGCKGLTVYVTGSRDMVVLETKDTQKKRRRSRCRRHPDDAAIALPRRQKTAPALPDRADLPHRDPRRTQLRHYQ